MSDYSGSTWGDLDPVTPTGLEPVANVDNAIRQIKRVLKGTGFLDYIYPVGAIWISTTNDDPATFFGLGTWRKLEGVALVAHKDGDAEFGTVTADQAGADVGSKTHQLTIAELPEHTHDLDINNEAGIDGDGYGAGVAYRVERPTSPPQVDIENELVGGDEPHNNIQPSRVVYMWERTA